MKCSHTQKSLALKGQLGWLKVDCWEKHGNEKKKRWQVWQYMRSGLVGIGFSHLKDNKKEKNVVKLSKQVFTYSALQKI